jgi:competence ComEA-like helix-hairpin-helix protein
MDQPDSNLVQPTPPLSPLGKGAETAEPSTASLIRPLHRWELGLAFLLGIFVLLLIQSAWKLWQPATPLILAPGSLDLNAATVQELRQLPGVGAQLAQRIVEHRQRHGPFTTLNDLQAVHGIGPATVERFKQFILVSQQGGPNPSPGVMQPLRSGPKQSPSELVDLNLASAQQLMTLPGIGPALADRIIADRQERGQFKTVNDLTRIRGIKAKTVEKLAPFVKVSTAERST